MQDKYEFNLQQEAQYVLGMMDLYQNDSEVASFLKMKGLSDNNINQVLSYIKQEGYHKRIRQAKKIALIGFALMVCLGSVWLIFTNSSIYHSKVKGEWMLRAYAKTLTDIAFYGFLFGIFQTVIGAYRFFNYSSKLNKTKT